MRKRKDSVEEENSEMEIEGEEKIEHNDEDADSSDDDDDDDDEEEEEDDDDDENENEVENSARPTGTSNPFLDAFYSLSSEDSRDRVQAAQTIIHSCLLGPTANSKDAAYTFRRLLNGLCSGRAAARQGNASALSNFLKVAFHLKKMKEIRDEGNDTTDPSFTLLEFVRGRLLTATDPSQTTGKKKGSEERDYQFGRLFGIIAVVRSGILLPSGEDEEEVADAMGVSSNFISDIAELFWLKKWMREPAAHGITTLLKLFLDGDNVPARGKIYQKLVQDVVIPKVLLVTGNGDEKHSNHRELFEAYCAEQVGVACFIQSQVVPKKIKLPFPLDKAVLSTETVPYLAQALGETSSVVQPRMHFVWDAMWCYLTNNTDSDKKGGKRGLPSQRRFRAKSLVGDDSPNDILDELIRKVVLQQLLRLDTDSSESTGKATHERRSLALCIVRNLSGAAFVSTLTGPTQIFLDEDSLENILFTPSIVRSLFLDVICAGNQKTSHLLKPLALNVLELMTNTSTTDEDYSRNRRMSLARAFLKCEVRFDARTRTTTVTSLLNYTATIEEGSAKDWIVFWNNYRTWLESHFLESVGKSNENQPSSYTTGLIELLYSLAKNILRLDSESEEDKTALKTFKETTVRHVLNLFMPAAFFDCSKMDDSTKSEAKKKKGKKSSKTDVSPVVEYGSKLKENLRDDILSRDARYIISSRFFSLASDFVHMETHQPKGSPGAVTEKDTKTLEILSELCDNWKQLEKNGAVRFLGSLQKDKNNESDDDDDIDPEKIIEELQAENERISNSSSTDNLYVSKVRFCRGINILARTLYLHRLTCERAEDIADNDDPDIDEEDDEEEICSALEGLQSIMGDFLGDKDEEANPLLGLTEVCTNTLSSPLGSGNIGRGASPKMVREAVKFAWLGGLRLSSEISSEDKPLFDSEVVSTLLSSIGASTDDENDSPDSDDEDGDDEAESENDTNSEAPSEENVFGQASELLGERDDMDVDQAANESDVELEPGMVQSFLEEDSDASVNPEELEHHEGADAALAKLIALKQASRKAGQQAREKIEIAHQLRCTFLFELLFSRPEAWSQLFNSDVILGMLIPLLRQRKNLEKSLGKMTDAASKSGVGDKRALLDRLSHLIKQKIGKLKSFAPSSSSDVEQTSNVVTMIMNEVKRADSKEQISCCSAALVLSLRSIKVATDVVRAASVLVDAVRDWSTKRTTRIQAGFFDDIVSHMPSLSQATLVSPMITATKEARSHFLKAEAFRLLSLLFASKPNPEPSSDLEKLALAKIEECGKDLLEAFESSLQDAEMQKAKRVRIVLKALEKYLPYVASSGSTDLAESLGAVKKYVENLGGDGGSESNAVKNICTKLSSEIDETVSSVKSAPAMDTTEEPNEEQISQAQNSESSKSKKKKKKKKKK